MLDEQEWQEVFPLLSEGLEQIKRHRAAHGSSLTEAKDAVDGNGALKLFFGLPASRNQHQRALAPQAQPVRSTLQCLR
jgi:hypothetical protein